MSKFDPSKLSVTILLPTTLYTPIKGRRYTLTHSDQTGNLFLYIGYTYHESSINLKMRDEVLGEWRKTNKERQYMLCIRVYVSGGEFDEKSAQIRYLIFRKELPTALAAILYGDRHIFLKDPRLLDAPIMVFIESNFPQFHTCLFYGTPRQYFLS